MAICPHDFEPQPTVELHVPLLLRAQQHRKACGVCLLQRKPESIAPDTHTLYVWVDHHPLQATNRRVAVCGNDFLLDSLVLGLEREEPFHHAGAEEEWRLKQPGPKHVEQADVWNVGGNEMKKATSRPSRNTARLTGPPARMRTLRSKNHCKNRSRQARSQSPQSAT
eukprot:CAMPEP_0202799214 /NCGR_PEP_ID=MMETSP1388-20130828/97853_1 /ASSEMBLY_ACC=CAM_ASM_000864 /TAXON_ID=37098 /ORGANISM="Isochrysis sp, Strain CCMP1244" /LENGTH=166 /DNA_ID=CAMNT_0049469161 /DNA_START=116 /DNA_END=617 /DNA_ORIENTATION=+